MGSRTPCLPGVREPEAGAVVGQVHPLGHDGVVLCLGLISFGFGIAKFLQYLHGQESQPLPVFGSMTVGMSMIGVALVGLALLNLQHRRAVAELRRECPGPPRSVAGVMGILIMILEILAFAGALLRHS